MNSDDTEPPDSSINYSKKRVADVGLLNPEQDSEHDLEDILLTPDLNKGEYGVLNPTVHQDSEEGFWQILHRTRRRDSKGEYSTIDLRTLENPMKISKDSRILIKPEPNNPWESRGCEDPRMTKIGDTYFITYIAWDGLNAGAALAETTNFKKIKKYGVISSQTDLGDAINLVEDEKIKREWMSRYNALKNDYPEKTKIFPMNKDSSIEYKNGKWYLFLRYGPHIQIAIVDRLKDLKDNEFWREYIKNIRNYTFLKNDFDWADEKIGLGSPPRRIGNKIIGLVHGVDKNMHYKGTIFELNDDLRKPKSIIKNPLFLADKKIHLYESKNERTGEKYTKIIDFPTDLIKQRDRLFVYSGIADTFIGYRSTSLKWANSELDNPDNKINC